MKEKGQFLHTFALEQERGLADALPEVLMVLTDEARSWARDHGGELVSSEPERWEDTFKTKDGEITLVHYAWKAVRDVP
jgi:hypothetical protein